MITLLIIIIIWFIISCYRLNKICKENDEEFNPAAGTVFDWCGFLLGTGTIVMFLICLMFKYLP